MMEYMLTTVDNPYNPYNQWDEWFAFDLRHHYNSMQFLARVVRTSNDLSETDQALAIEVGIDEIVKENVNGMFAKIQRDGTILL